MYSFLENYIVFYNTIYLIKNESNSTAEAPALVLKKCTVNF